MEAGPFSRVLAAYLRGNEFVKPAVDLPSHVTAEAVSKFALRNIITELRSEQPDCSLLFTMLERTLYEQ